MAANFSPRFVKGKVRFVYENETFDVGEHLLNLNGIPGFKWTRFEPMDVVGKACRASVSLSSSTPFEFSCDATMTCEEVTGRTDLGIAFNITQADGMKLGEIITKEGVLPEYARKFPRIIFLENVGVMPSRAILKQSIGSENTEVVGDIVDMSPTGIQISTEDMRCAVTIPGEVWDVILQPRGGFASPVVFRGEVKRIIHSVDPKSYNAKRYFSMAITQITNEHKTMFTDLLRQVVTRIKG